MEKIEFYDPIFRAFLTKLEAELEGPDYGVEFGFTAADIACDGTDPEAVLSELVPDRVGTSTKLTEVSSGRILSEMKGKILVKDFDGRYPNHYDAELVRKVRDQRLPKLESHIRNYLTLNNASCYECDGLSGIPVLDVIWSFCFLLIEPKRKRALLIHGGASD